MIVLNIRINASLETTWLVLTQPAAIQRWATNPGGWRCLSYTGHFMEGGNFKLLLKGEAGNWHASIQGHVDQIIPYRKVSIAINGGERITVTLMPQGEQVSCECCVTGAMDDSVFSKNIHRLILTRLKDYIEQLARLAG
ncbi:SRPBCC domain-containing protein [Salinimonas marina]|uniref:SRPBCC domain-containing protein n=1 Tax=Salinimonas marina TaxID=2785918 RepID=A0A7S9DVT0_9ALTE|nr:SRPBCC domain-containing protein [Salinimonas marina]QPG04770.1 SRPBCC domain-containing protein [Salinimonas marina]